MGRIIASTVASAWLGGIGYPTEVSGTLNEYLMAANTDFVSLTRGEPGIAAVRANGELWFSSDVDVNMFGLTISAYRPFSAGPSGYKNVLSWNAIPGFWAVDAANKLYYTGEHFVGCGLVYPGQQYVSGVVQIGTGTDWDKLESVSGSQSQEYGIFNLTDDVRTAGTNQEGALYSGGTGDVRTLPASIYALSGAKQMSCDGYLSPLFVTPSGDLYYVWVSGGIQTRLVDTNVKEILGGTQNYNLVYLKNDGSMWEKKQPWNVTYSPTQRAAGPFVTGAMDYSTNAVALIDAAGKVAVYTTTSFTERTTDLFPSYTVSKVVIVGNAVVGLEAPVPPPPSYFWQSLVGTTEQP